MPEFKAKFDGGPNVTKPPAEAIESAKKVSITIISLKLEWSLRGNLNSANLQ
jgi:hypothetical protein